MDFLKYGAFTILGITYLIIIILSIKSRKPIKFLFLNAFFGILVLLLVHFTDTFTGVTLPINEYTVLGSSSLGVPSVIGFLILNFILK